MCSRKFKLLLTLLSMPFHRWRFRGLRKKTYDRCLTLRAHISIQTVETWQLSLWTELWKTCCRPPHLKDSKGSQAVLRGEVEKGSILCKCPPNRLKPQPGESQSLSVWFPLKTEAHSWVLLHSTISEYFNQNTGKADCYTFQILSETHTIFVYFKYYLQAPKQTDIKLPMLIPDDF